MRNLKGNLVYWEISDFTVGKDELATMLAPHGFEDYIPRNDYRSAAVRALHKLLKGDESFYKQFGNKAESVSFAVIVPEEILGINAVQLKTETKVNICVGKTDGRVSFDVHTALNDRFLDLYAEARPTIGAGQFRTIVLDVLKKQCAGVAMRRSGGIYYVPQAFFPQLEKLKAVFALFPNNCSIYEVPIYDDASTQNALEVAIKEDILGDLESMLAELKQHKGDLTGRILENRQKEVQEMIKRVRIHAEDMRSEADTVMERLDNVHKEFGDAINLTMEKKPFNLREILETL